jgi:hypothetical protein
MGIKGAFKNAGGGVLRPLLFGASGLKHEPPKAGRFRSSKFGHVTELG